MTIDYDKLTAVKGEGIESSYTDRDTLLYAIAIGMGRDPLDPSELPYVCETQGDKVLPTVSSVLCPNVPTASANLEGVNYLLVLHGEQRVQLHRPIPPTADIITDSHIVDIYDKGADKGALILAEINTRLKDTNEPLFTIQRTTFARGDGGFGGKNEGAPVPHLIPSRDPDASCALPTRVDQALLYALCEDRNPLHRDPDVAAKAGYDRPILHGLCTYGVACHAVVKTMCDYDHTAITGFDVRFSAPVFPGETIITDMWKDGNIVSFRCRLKERDVLIINNGKCTLT